MSFQARQGKSGGGTRWTAATTTVRRSLTVPTTGRCPRAPTMRTARLTGPAWDLEGARQAAARVSPWAYLQRTSASWTPSSRAHGGSLAQLRSGDPSGGGVPAHDGGQPPADERSMFALYVNRLRQRARLCALMSQVCVRIDRELGAAWPWDYSMGPEPVLLFPLRMRARGGGHYLNIK